VGSSPPQDACVTYQSKKQKSCQRAILSGDNNSYLKTYWKGKIHPIHIVALLKQGQAHAFIHPKKKGQAHESNCSHAEHK
jgi:hypothetical protein